MTTIRGLGIVIVSLLMIPGAGEGTAQEPITARSMKRVWEYPTPDSLPQAVVEEGAPRQLLYVALKQGGLAVLDNSRRAQPPREIARLSVSHFQNLHVMNLVQSGRRLYLALGDLFDAQGAPAGLAIVDVDVPRKPRVIGLWVSTESLNGSAAVLVADGKAYLAAMSAGVMVFEVSRPDHVERLCLVQPDINFPTPNPQKLHHPNARGMALRGDLLYVAYDAGGLRVLNVSNPRQPREIGRYVNPRFPNKPQAYNNLVLDGDRAYVATDYAGLEVLDIRNPRQIRSVGWWNPWHAETLTNLWFNSPGHTNQIAWHADRKQVWMSAGDSELQIVDVSRPAQPQLVAQYGAPRDQQGAWGVTLSGNRAYLTYINATVPFQGTWSGIRAVE